MVISRYSATLLLLSPVAAAKNSVLASATAIAESTAKLAITGYVSAVSPDLSAPSAVAARWNRPYICEPISRLRCAAARVTVTFSPAASPTAAAGRTGIRAADRLVERRQPPVGAGHRRRPARPTVAVAVAGVVGHPGMLVAGIGGRPRRVVPRITPALRAPVVTPRSGHATILPHRGDRSATGDRCGYACPGQALWVAMDSVTESAEQGAAAGPSGSVVDRPADLEAVLMGAVEQARAAIVEFSGENTVGEYLGAGFDDPTAATHRFLADSAGLPGLAVGGRRGRLPRCHPRHRQRSGAGAGADGAAGAEVGAVAGAGPSPAI